MTIDIERIVIALRDTAEKATATTTIERPQPKQFGNVYSGEGTTYTEILDKYDRQWIAGRLLGMADMIEALTKERTD